MHLTRILLCLAIVSASGRADAQMPTEAEVRAANQHAQRGRAQFDAGHYQKAVQELEAAYKLEPDPELQYRIGEAHRLNDEDAQAIAAYRRYLDVEPEGPEAHNAHRHLRELGAEKRTPKKRAVEAVAPPPPPKAAPAPAPAPPPTAAPSPALDLTAKAPEEKPHKPWTPWKPRSKRDFWLIVGGSAGAAAVIVLGVGLGVGLRAHETVFTEVRP